MDDEKDSQAGDEAAEETDDTEGQRSGPVNQAIPKSDEDTEGSAMGPVKS